MKAQIIQSKLITSPHGFSTRIGGVSTGIYESLNLGMNRGDDEELVKKNWDLFLEACGIKEKSFVCGNQIHSNIVHIAQPADLRPAYGPGKLIDADGYVTNTPGVALAIFTADCVPVLLEDKKNKVIGCLHAGWRGAVSDIEKNGIEKMCELGAETGEIRVAIGPAIDICCFEVGEEVVRGIQDLLGQDAQEFFVNKPDGKYMVNLRGAVKKRFMQLGVIENNIEFAGECTMCHPDKYWSHRYTKGIRGSLASVITL